MNFHNLYMLNLSIRISDFENTKKFYSKVNKKINREAEENLSKYCTDLRIYNLLEKNNKDIYNHNFLLNLMNNPFDNFSIIKEHINKTNYKIEDFVHNDKSLLLNILKSSNNLKKLKVCQFLLDKKDFDFGVKNKDGQTNSQILTSENPTDMNAVFLEKIEKLMMNKTLNNNFLFYDLNFHGSYSITNSDLLEKEIKSFISEPEDSYKINFADIEFKLLKLNLKLRRMYEINILKLSNSDTFKDMSKLHTKVMEDFIFEKLLVDKI